MKIHQVAVNYLHEHDRILVQVNNARHEEIRFWLTRRLCCDWIPVLNASVLDLLQRQLPMQASSGGAEASDFDKPYRQAVQHWPLGVRPLLVGSVQMSPSTCGGVRFAFEETAERLGEQRRFQALMTRPLVQAFAHLLDHALDASEWQPAGWSGTIPKESIGALDPGSYLH